MSTDTVMTCSPSRPAAAKFLTESISGREVRARLRDGEEVALFDVREEALFAEAHPLFAANFPLSRIELDAWSRLPRRNVLVVLDARRFDEYHTMSIPGATSVPGAELVLRVRDLAPRPETLVIVNCAGRTRSIIGTQSLVNAGLPNRVAGLRNGTIGWTLAGQGLEKGKTRRFADLGPTDATHHAQARIDSRSVADRAGVTRLDRAILGNGEQDTARTTYRVDVRTPDEFAAGHLSGFLSAPGGQLVQETDHFAPVRGALIVLADDDCVRANMTASWLAQMGWNVAVLDGLAADDFDQRGDNPAVPDAPPSPMVTPAALSQWLTEGDMLLLDFGSSAHHVKRHIPDARFVLRSQLAVAIEKLPVVERYVVSCD